MKPIVLLVAYSMKKLYGHRGPIPTVLRNFHTSSGSMGKERWFSFHLDIL
jgi:hypothetical protein